MTRILLILFCLLSFLSKSEKCETIYRKDTAVFKFKKNIRYVRFKKAPPFKGDWVITDTNTFYGFNITRLAPNAKNPKDPLLGMNFINYELPIEVSPDRYSIRDYFDIYSQRSIEENPDLTITQLYVDGMARYPYIIIKLEGHLEVGLNKKTSSLWFGIRLNREIKYTCFIFKGKEIPLKLEQSYVTYLKDFEIVEE